MTQCIAEAEFRFVRSPTREINDMTDSGESFGTELKRAVNIKTARGSRIREEIGDFVIEEQSVTGDTYGEYRFALDRRVRQPDGTVRLVNVGWYKTYRGAMNALSMECQS